MGTANVAIGRAVAPGDAVLLRTMQEDFAADDPQFYNQPGTKMSATILGTDNVGWDLSF